MVFLKLLFAHAITDWALQTQFLATYKSRHYEKEHPIPGHKNIWVYCLIAHAMINGAGVWLITGSPIAGIAETIAHTMIDFGKCEKLYNLHVDQYLHVFTKFIWAIPYIV